MMPSDQGAPGADEAGVADYIDGFLGAFTFDPPRIWAGGPTLGPQGRRGRLRQLPPACRALDELAWRMRLEGSQGLPEREFNGPVVGLQERYRDGLAALGRRLHRGGRHGAAAPAARRRGVLRAPVGALLRGHVRRARVRGQPRRRRLGRTSTTRATCSRAATATPRCRSRDARAPSSSGPGPGGATAAEVLTRAGWSVVIMEKGRNHLLDPDDLTKPAGDYSNDEIKFISRYFLGPDPLVEPRAFRRSADEGEHTHVGEVNSIPTTVGGGGTHADGKVPRFREEDFRLLLHLRAPGGRRGRRLAARLRRARAVLRRGRAGHRRGRPGGRQPVRRLALRALPDAARARRCTAPCCRRPRPRRSACIPTRRRRRPTASPTTAARPATTAASAPSSAAPSTPRATRWRC